MSRKQIKFLRHFARTVILLVASFWFIFALLSGAQELGGGLRGVLLNSANALPWLILFAFVYLVWRFEFVGGIVISIFGILTIFMFDTFESLIAFLLISLPLILLGGIFILVSKKEPRKK